MWSFATSPGEWTRTAHLKPPGTIRFLFCHDRKPVGNEDEALLLDRVRAEMRLWRSKEGRKGADLGSENAANTFPKASDYLKSDAKCYAAAWRLWRAPLALLNSGTSSARSS